MIIDKIEFIRFFGERMVRLFRYKLIEVYSIVKEIDMFCLIGGFWWFVGFGIGDGVGWG